MGYFHLCKSSSDVFLLFLKYMCPGANSPGSMHQGVKDTVLCREVVMAVPL